MNILFCLFSLQTLPAPYGPALTLNKLGQLKPPLPFLDHSWPLQDQTKLPLTSPYDSFPHLIRTHPSLTRPDLGQTISNQPWSAPIKHQPKPPPETNPNQFRYNPTSFDLSRPDTELPRPHPTIPGPTLPLTNIQTLPRPNSNLSTPSPTIPN